MAAKVVAGLSRRGRPGVGRCTGRVGQSQRGIGDGTANFNGRRIDIGRQRELESDSAPDQYRRRRDPVDRRWPSRNRSSGPRRGHRRRAVHPADPGAGPIPQPGRSSTRRQSREPWSGTPSVQRAQTRTRADMAASRFDLIAFVKPRRAKTRGILRIVGIEQGVFVGVVKHHTAVVVDESFGRAPSAIITSWVSSSRWKYSTSSICIGLDDGDAVDEVTGLDQHAFEDTSRDAAKSRDRAVERRRRARPA